MSIDKTKTDAVLGKDIIAELTNKGLMIPMTELAKVSNKDKIAKISVLFAEIIDVLGYDRNDEELQDTPNRIAKMWVNELFNAWDESLFPNCTSFDNRGVGSFADEMVIVRNIKVVSNCAHHFTTTDIKVDVAYVADEKMIGISKINRIVKRLARNPTSQETLGKAIATAISMVTESSDVVVNIEGTHYCVVQRGAEDVGSTTLTLAAMGKFAEDNSALRKEFIAAIK